MISLALLLIASGAAVYGLLLMLYRVTLHPLAHIPGSKIAAATKWYEFYFDILKKPGAQYGYEVSRMHDKYGPIVRINPQEVHIRDPEFFNVLYATNARRFKYPPAARMTGIPSAAFATIDHDLHKKRRGANTAMFSTRAIHGPASEVLCEEADTMSRNLMSMYEKHETRDIHEAFLAYTSVFAGRYFLGTRLDYQDNRRSLAEWYKTITAVNKSTVVAKQFPWMPKLMRKLPKKSQARLAPPMVRMLELQQIMQSRARKFLNDISGKAIDSKSSEVPPTLLHAITRSSLPPEEKSYTRLWQESFSIFAASADTTARSLTYSTYFLLTSPDFYARLRKELGTVMPNANDIPKYKSIESLPLLRATVKESLRCMHVVMGRVPICCPEDLRYSRYTIPAGTPTSMTPDDVMMNPQIYPSPQRFDPDRWLKDGKLHSDLDQYFVAFGKGPRQCQGIDMAWAMILRGLATVHRRFELTLDGVVPERDVDIKCATFLGDPSPQSKGLQVKVSAVRE